MTDAQLVIDELLLKNNNYRTSLAPIHWKWLTITYQ